MTTSGSPPTCHPCASGVEAFRAGTLAGLGNPFCPCAISLGEIVLLVPNRGGFVTATTPRAGAFSLRVQGDTLDSSGPRLSACFIPARAGGAFQLIPARAGGEQELVEGRGEVGVSSLRVRGGLVSTGRDCSGVGGRVGPV